MKNLVLKEFKISYNRVLIMCTGLFGVLLLIPNWVYIVAFMYIFWLLAPAILGEFNSQNDFTFTQMLPVSKNDIVTSKIIAFALVELIPLITGVVVGIFSILIHGRDTFFLNLGPSFFGNVLIMYGIWNLVFFPWYFKTAVKFGIPVTIATITACLYGVIIEVLNLFVPSVNNLLESTNILTQIGLLGFGIIFFISTAFIAIIQSRKNFAIRQ